MDATLVERVLRGDPRAIARAISVVEDESPATAGLLASLHPHTGRATVVGVTGPPGAGKSTLVDGLIRLLRAAERTVGVVAVDPSSPFSGGAILGDRVRMGGYAADAGVFIRSMATRGHLGGLARTTGNVITVLDAAGRDVVIVETVGVGQDEVEIVRHADVSIVVLVPGTGDDVQAIKAGIMEIGDVFVVNKADREGADRLVQAVLGNLALNAYADGQWKPPVLKTEATTGAGVGEVWEAVERFRANAPDTRTARRRDRGATTLRGLIASRLLDRVDRSMPPADYDGYVDRIAAGTSDPYTAADEIVARVLGPAVRGGKPRS